MKIKKCEQKFFVMQIFFFARKKNVCRQNLFSLNRGRWHVIFSVMKKAHVFCCFEPNHQNRQNSEKCNFEQKQQKLTNPQKLQISTFCPKMAKNAILAKNSVLAQTQKTENRPKNGAKNRVWFGKNVRKHVSSLNRGSVVPWLTVGKKVLDPPQIFFAEVHCFPIEILGERRGGVSEKFITFKLIRWKYNDAISTLR